MNNNFEKDIVVAKGLTKCFKDFCAVDHINFSVHKQECCALLGPNGAGKTTTIKMVSCFLEPSGGYLEVLGKEVQANPRYIKCRIGICPQEVNLDPDLTVIDNLIVFARYFNIIGNKAKERSEELLRFTGLFPKKFSPIDELSGGMKRRLLIARSLLNYPEILILDEPTTGLDPQSRHQIWESLHKLKKQGTTIFMTTHYMDEAQHLSDRLIVMDEGRIIEEGNPSHLVKKHIGTSVIEIAFVSDEVEKYLNSKNIKYERTSTHIYIHGNGLVTVWKEITKKFGEEFCMLRMANLEDVFLKLTGRQLREI